MSTGRAALPRVGGVPQGDADDHPKPTLSVWTAALWALIPMLVLPWLERAWHWFVEAYAAYYAFVQGL